MISVKDYLKLSDFSKVIFQNAPIDLSVQMLKKVEQSFIFLQEFSSNKVIYGVNTGFGPMAQYRIQEQDCLQLQYNLIRSHCSGTGAPLNALHTKAAVLARLNTLSQGYSGVNTSVLEVMKELINHNIHPLIFSHGGVGASGDLVQLAHLALILIGEGEVFYEGKRQPTPQIFKKLGIAPLTMKIREGLALMNGTSVMTGIGIVNALQTRQLIQWSMRASCIINEIVHAYDDHLSEALNGSKHHKGQQEIAQQMRLHLQDSQLIRKREDYLYTGENQEVVFKEKVQEYYSIRCIPQILGPVLDTLSYTEEVLEGELNSANDNPIIDLASQQVYHGGNFHGDYISLEMDKLKLAVTKMSMLAERQLNFLLNHKINEILPPFVNLGTLGFNFGMQGAQFTATSTTAENQALSTSMYIHSIPNNNDNQDVVSMGTNAALLCSRVIENAYEVLAIEYMTIIQALDALQVVEKTAQATQAIYKELRNIVPVFTQDQVLYPYVQQVKEYLMKDVNV